MHSKHAEPSARSFDAMSAIGLSEEARKAVNEAFDAMSDHAGLPSSSHLPDSAAQAVSLGSNP
jgi:hypothetical protein